jgi:hypothetical protein
MKKIFLKEDGNYIFGWVLIIVAVLIIGSLFIGEEEKKKNNNKKTTQVTKKTQFKNTSAVKNTKKAQLKKAHKTKKSRAAKQGQAVRSKQAGNAAFILLKKIPVQNENRSGYDRDKFEHWSDLNNNGCDTRDEVLAIESGSKCKALKGPWYSAYDGVVTYDSGDFDVDHMVPLAEAWDSGARNWTDSKRELYANDLYPHSLIAVSASSNRSKSDQDPAEWLPTRTQFTCQYAVRWLAVKYRWRLSFDLNEKQALNKILRSCPKSKLKIKAPPRA